MPLKTHLDEQPTLNLTSMIDVVFLLLIFFMVGTKFSELERNIDVRVPEVAAAKAPGPAPGPRVVTVLADGRILLDRTPVDNPEELARELAAARKGNADVAVLVRGDADGKFQQIAEVLAACRQAEVRQLGISVRAQPVRR
ncbi:MAG: ExbD/TolR family protein [Thermoguttaceae bacterium]